MTPGADIEHDARLPWGHWMRTVSTPGRDVVIVDEHGQHWSSLRHALWNGRLNARSSNPHVIGDGCEIILAMLESTAAGRVPPGEVIISLQAANATAFWYLVYWLQAAGLLQPGGGPMGAHVTPEGASVALMLLVTRPSELEAVPFGAAAVRAFGSPGSPTECSRVAFDAADGPSASYPYAIVRETRFRRHEIAMLHRDPEDAIPMARTIWSVSCPDAATRDRLFAWAHDRLDRWTAWGQMAKEHGAQVLSQHLLSLIASEPSFGRKDVEPETSQDPSSTGAVSVGQDR